MEYSIIHPDDPSMFEFPMVKFKFITDNHSISFVIQDKFSESKLREQLEDISPGDLEDIIKAVKGNYSEEQIGDSEFSEITSVVKIKRLLPCQT